jgi:hypothetical protein
VVAVAEDLELSRLQLALLVLYGSVERWAGASPYSAELMLENGGSAVLHFGKSAAYAQE